MFRFIVNVFSVFVESVFIANVKFKAHCNSTYLSQKEKKKNSSDIGNVKFKADCNSTYLSQKEKKNPTQKKLL